MDSALFCIIPTNPPYIQTTTILFQNTATRNTRSPLCETEVSDGLTSSKTKYTLEEVWQILVELLIIQEEIDMPKVNPKDKDNHTSSSSL
jgi:hypothetical protein